MTNTLMMVPGCIYAISLFVMTYFAIMQKRSSGMAFYTAGAVFFVISDSVLALNEFVTDIPFASTLVLLTYYLAQYFLNLPHLMRRRHLHRHHHHQHNENRNGDSGEAFEEFID